MVGIGEIKLAKEIGRIGAGRHIWYACADCGKERWVLLARGKPKYTLCLSCSMKGKVNHNWKGGIKHVEGYIYLSLPEHPEANKQGYVSRARLVLEQKLGRYLLGGHEPHHKNGIKDDDRPKNLEELTRSEHKKLHNRGKKLGKGIYIDSYCCGNCSLNEDEVCTAFNLRLVNSKGACNLIHKNFIDRGYTYKARKIDFFPPKDTSIRSEDAEG